MTREGVTTPTHLLAGVLALLAGFVVLTAGGATPPATAAPGECPPGYEPVGPVDPTDPGFPGFTDDNVNVLVGGDLLVTEAAAEAEGRVVVLGGATFAKDAGGVYNVGVVGVGSGVVPSPGTTMLAVGGDVDGNGTTVLDVGAGVGADVEAGGEVRPSITVETNGGQVRDGEPGATAPWAGLPALLSATSARYAALPATGTVETTGFSATLTGDGVSDPQVFTVDGDTLTGASRSLQLLDVPEDAAIVVNLTGPTAGLELNAVLGSDGTVLDPFADQEFVDLTTRLLWNVPAAADVTLAGSAQLPGSLLVPTPGGRTDISVPGTNGRVWVAGDLTHRGVGAEMHAYPFLPDDDLDCRPVAEATGAVSVRKVLDDPDGVVPADQRFTGTVACALGGDDVTPADDSWSVPADGTAAVVADGLPVGAVCRVTEVVPPPPADGYAWDDPQVAPASVTVVADDVVGFTVTNRAVAEDPTDPPTTDPPTSDPPTTDPPDPTEPPSSAGPSQAGPSGLGPSGAGPSATSGGSGVLPDTGAPAGLLALAAAGAVAVVAGVALLSLGWRRRSPRGGGARRTAPPPAR